MAQIDASIPMGVQTPNAMGMLGNIVNTAQGVQNLQMGQIGQQSAGLALQMQKIKQDEWNNVAQAIQNGDQALHPNALGVIDPNKAAVRLQQLAPHTYNLHMQDIQTSNQAALKTNSDMTDLGSKFVNTLGDNLNASNGTKSGMLKAIADTMEQSPGSGIVLNPALDALSKIDDKDTASLTAFKTYGANRAYAVGQQIANKNAGVRIVNQGTQEQAVATPGNMEGKETGTTVGESVPMGVAPSYQLNKLGVPVYLPGKMPNWQSEKPAATGPNQTTPNPAGVSLSGAPKGAVTPPPVPAFMDEPTADRIKQYQTKWQTLQGANADSTSGYQNTTQIYRNLMDELKSNPTLGPGASKLNQLSGGLLGAGNVNAGYQKVSAYLDSLAQARAGNVGATTNMGREQAAGAVGSPTYVHDALQEKLRFGAAVNEASNGYTTAASNFFRRHGNNGAAYGQQFDAAWTANSDPVAFRMMADHNIGDKEDLASISKQATPANLHHYLMLRDYLLKGFIPPS